MSARVSASAVAVSAMRGTLAIALVQHRQAQIVLAEVVAPLADAMRLVDGEEREQAALVQRIELGQHARRGDALGRGIEQHEPAAHHLALDARCVVAVSSVELRNAACTPASSRAPTWSCISAISGLTTTATPCPARCRTIAGTW